MLFEHNLNGWDSWSSVFQSKEAFFPLAKAIFDKEGLPLVKSLETLPPGTNAVFKANELIIKIYAPIQTNLDTQQDYATELAVMEFAMNHNISIPKIIGHGEFMDKYLFRYLIMDYVPAAFSIQELLLASSSEKKEFVNHIKQISVKLHQPAQNLLPRIDLRIQDNRMNRMDGLNPNLIKELARCAENLDYDEVVLVHGDITRDNLIIGTDRSVTLIDFADCIMAPAYYELPAIIFELFLCDQELVAVYIGEEDRELFLDALIKGLSIHLFCGFILKDYFERSDIPRDRVASIDELRLLLQKQLFPH
ncbi:MULTISPECIES: aminoglycoside phosphotransferase family protein [unclassified Paenibacillus]|uniref:aminoglycoside phosphotransferase family protein n=1 Tax=unclassified Paenibacillus TaxID=185978 RepID=UPI003119F938